MGSSWDVSCLRAMAGRCLQTSTLYFSHWPALSFRQVGLRGGSASTLRPAIAHVLGVRAPAAFWDPLELSADGDVALFKSRKAASVVHGRMCMVACAYELGCQHFSQSFVAWADMPGALQTCTAEFLALCELFSHKFGWHRRAQPVKSKSPKSDLIAGRLAMVAVSSLCCQEALADTLVCLDLWTEPTV